MKLPSLLKSPKKSSRNSSFSANPDQIGPNPCPLCYFYNSAALPFVETLCFKPCCSKNGQRSRKQSKSSRPSAGPGSNQRPSRTAHYSSSQECHPHEPSLRPSTGRHSTSGSSHPTARRWQPSPTGSSSLLCSHACNYRPSWPYRLFKQVETIDLQARMQETH